MISKMRNFITIANKVTSKDSAGFESFDHYETVLETRATMEQKKANEFWANVATFSSADTLFKFRRDPNVEIGTDMNILVGQDVYNILYVDAIKGAGLYVEIFAERIIPSRG